MFVEIIELIVDMKESVLNVSEIESLKETTDSNNMHYVLIEMNSGKIYKDHSHSLVWWSEVLEAKA